MGFCGTAGNPPLKIKNTEYKEGQHSNSADGMVNTW